MRITAVSFMVIVLLASVGCRVKQLLPADYMSWIKNEGNGLHVTKRVEGYSFSAQYKPAEYEALLHMKKEGLTKAGIDSAASAIKQLQYLTFTISTPDKKDPASGVSVSEADYYQRLNYMMFDMQRDFYLVDGKDTVPCALYHYERNYDLSQENNFLLGFELPKDNKNISDKTIVYDDHLLGMGPVLITIRSGAIQSVPEIITDN